MSEMKRKKLEKKCYELYKVDWKKSYGITAEREEHLLEEYRNFIDGFDSTSGTNENYIRNFEDYLIYEVLNGDWYRSFEEFLDSEFLDGEYMKKLLPEKLFHEYCRLTEYPIEDAKRIFPRGLNAFFCMDDSAEDEDDANVYIALAKTEASANKLFRRFAKENSINYKMYSCNKVEDFESATILTSEIKVFRKGVYSIETGKKLF